jgi:hypothetical protein
MPEKPEKKAAIEEALRGFKFRNPIRDKVGKGKKKKTKGLKGGKGKSARTEKPGVPHGVDKKTQKGEQILEVAKGGSVTGRGIGPAGASIVSDDGKRIKQLKTIAKGGSVTGRGIGPAGASIVSDDGKRIKQLKTIAKSLASPTTAGLIGGFKKAAGQLAGRLAKRGYGKARK